MLDKYGHVIEKCTAKGIVGLSKILAKAAPETIESIILIIEKYTGLDILDIALIEKLSDETVNEINSKLHRYTDSMLVDIDKLTKKTIPDGKVPDDIRCRVDDADATWLERHFKHVVVLMCIAFVFIFCTIVAYVEIPKNKEQLLTIIVTTLMNSVLALILNYLFGNSDKKTMIRPTPPSPVKPQANLRGV